MTYLTQNAEYKKTKSGFYVGHRLTLTCIIKLYSKVHTTINFEVLK
jgi:hypothetical protein